MTPKPKNNGPLWFLSGVILTSIVWGQARAPSAPLPQAPQQIDSYNTMDTMASANGVAGYNSLAEAQLEASPLNINTETLNVQSRAELAQIEPEETYDVETDEPEIVATVPTSGQPRLPHPGQSLTGTAPATAYAADTTQSQSAVTTPYSYAPTYRARPSYSYAAPVAPSPSYDSGYGAISSHTGRPRTVAVRGYTRSDGTYVRAHYRSAPRR